MDQLVALHTQALQGEVLESYLDRVSRSLRAARLNSSFPDRRRLQNSLDVLKPSFSRGLYPQVYIDARTGLPNMASITRVVTDRQVAPDSLRQLATDRKRVSEGEVFERLAVKYDYYTALHAMNVAPVDEQKVALRRHDPKTGTAMFRIDMTKLDATGNFIRVNIELTQVSSIWRRHVIDLDASGETAAATGAFHSTIYRYAAYDAETLFLHLHDIEGVSVDRVSRGIIGPVLFAIPHEGKIIRPLEIPESPMRTMWEAFMGEVFSKPEAKPQLIANFASDTAARDVRDEKSNDPLSPLLSQRITEQERARYNETRKRFPFKVYKDRKFVVSPELRPLIEKVCESQGTKNLIYRVA